MHLPGERMTEVRPTVHPVHAHAVFRRRCVLLEDDEGRFLSHRYARTGIVHVDAGEGERARGRGRQDEARRLRAKRHRRAESALRCHHRIRHRAQQGDLVDPDRPRCGIVQQAAVHTHAQARDGVRPPPCRATCRRRNRGGDAPVGQVSPTRERQLVEAATGGCDGDGRCHIDLGVEARREMMRAAPAQHQDATTLGRFAGNPSAAESERAQRASDDLHRVAARHGERRRARREDDTGGIATPPSPEQVGHRREAGDVWRVRQNVQASKWVAVAAAAVAAAAAFRRRIYAGRDDFDESGRVLEQHRDVGVRERRRGAAEVDPPQVTGVDRKAYGGGAAPAHDLSKAHHERTVDERAHLAAVGPHQPLLQLPVVELQRRLRPPVRREASRGHRDALEASQRRHVADERPRAIDDQRRDAGARRERGVDVRSRHADVHRVRQAQASHRPRRRATGERIEACTVGCSRRAGQHHGPQPRSRRVQRVQDVRGRIAVVDEQAPRRRDRGPARHLVGGQQPREAVGARIGDAQRDHQVRVATCCCHAITTASRLLFVWVEEVGV